MKMSAPVMMRRQNQLQLAVVIRGGALDLVRLDGVHGGGCTIIRFQSRFELTNKIHAKTLTRLAVNQQVSVVVFQAGDNHGFHCEQAAEHRTRWRMKTDPVAIKPFRRNVVTFV